MRKVFMFLAVMLLVASTAFAGNWVVGVEGTQVEQKIDNTELLSLGYQQVFSSGDFTDIDYAAATLYNDIKSLDISQYLATVGYKFSDTFTPYLILGMSSLEYDGVLRGSAVIGEQETWTDGSDSWSYPIAGDILRGSFEDNSDITSGFGITGDVKDFFSGLTLTYDVRHIEFNANNSGSVCVLPDLTDYSVTTESDFEYNSWSAAAILSKEFELKDKEGNPGKYIKSLTPSIGYRYTTLALNVKTSTNIPLWDDTNVQVRTEQSIRSNLNTLLLGLKAKINDNWSASVNGMMGNEKGMGVKVCYSF